MIGAGALVNRVFAGTRQGPPSVAIGPNELAQLDSDGLLVHAGYLITGDSQEPRAINLRCTHLGCTVAYDHGANELVCPCHRSRFDLTGRVLSGPATAPLAEARLRKTNDRWELEPGAT